MNFIETNINEIEQLGVLPPEISEECEGYKETKVMWLSAGVMVLSNDEVPINEDIVKALDMISELVRRAKVDRSVEEYAERMRRKGIVFTDRTETAVIRKAV